MRDCLTDVSYSEELDHLESGWLNHTNRIKNGVDLTKNYVTFGFEFLDKSNELNFSDPTLVQFLSSRKSARYGSDPFFMAILRDSYIPIIKDEGIQANLLLDDNGRKNHFPIFSMWRIHRRNIGISAIGYWEDDPMYSPARFDSHPRKWKIGKEFCLEMQSDLIRNFLVFVALYAGYIEYSGMVQVSVNYNGLEGRSLNSLNYAITSSNDHTCIQDKLLVTAKLDTAEIQWGVFPEIISELLQPINNLFQTPSVTKKKVDVMLNYFDNLNVIVDENSLYPQQAVMAN